MRKLKLNLEALEVATFETGGGKEAPGTVHAQSIPLTFIGCPPTEVPIQCSPTGLPLICPAAAAAPAGDGAPLAADAR